jgi:hypothetical protein
VNEERLREALRDPALDDPAARARALAVVRAAHREREPAPRRWAPVLVLAACALAAVVVAASVSAPGDAVARWVRQMLGAGEPHARPALVRVPGGGRLLVSSAGAVWAVAPDGSRRRLGNYDGGSWSPRGLYAAVWRGGELLAVEPNGRVHWSLARPGRIRAARWSPLDGYRVAYLSGRTLRIVWGDGANDRRLGAARAVAPAWRPDAAHDVTYVDARRRIRAVAVDSGRELWRTRPHSRVFEHAWSPDGRRLVAATPRRLLLFSRSGRLLAVRRVAGGRLADDVTFSPGGRLTVVRGDERGSQVVVGGRVLFRGPGRFGPVQWSPTGRRLLVPWPEADQWLFLDADGGRAAAVANIARQFARGPARRAFPGAVEWCCRR